MIKHKNIRVLIAEDDYLVGEMIKGLLAEVGYSVAGEAGDGLEAVEMVQSLRPDVVLMDIKMPDIDGIEAVRRIHEHCPTPVVALTAYETPELVQEASAAGVGAYLVKPSTAQEMERAITVAMARFDDMMELRRLNAEQQARNRELALLNHAARAFGSTLDLEQVLNGILEETRRLLDVVACSVWLVDPETDELICWQSTGPYGEDVRGWRLAQGEGLAGWVAKSGESLIVPDTRADERHFKGIDQRTGWEVRSVLGVPLSVKEQAIGVLEAVDTEADRFRREDLALLEPLAASAAIATENARLYQEADRLRAFNENIVQGMEEGILLEDATGHIIFANPKMTELLGYTLEELRGLHCMAIVAPECMARAEEHRATWVQGMTNRYETILLTKQGQQVPTIVSTRGLSEGGEFSGVLCVFTDITERKRMEEAVRESEERYRAFFEQAADSIVLIDAETGELVEFNDRAYENLGYTREEFQKLKIPDFEVIESVEEVTKHIEKIIKEGIDIFETKHRTKDDEIRHILVSSRAISVLGRDFVQSTWSDITERVRAEEALQQHAAQLTLLNDIGGKIAAVLDLDSVLDRAARLVQESFGYHHVGLYTVDRERGRLGMRARAGSFTERFPPDHGLKMGEGMVGWVGLHGEVLLANDVEAEPHYVNLYPDVIPTRSELSVPIRIGGQIIGVLDVQSPELDAFAENDVTLIQTLADQLAVAIDNARLYDAVRQELAERKRAEAERERLLVAEHEQRLLAETLREVTLTLTSHMDHQAVLDEILRQAQQLVPYSTAHIMLLEGEILHVARWRGYDAFDSEAFIANLEQPLADLPLDTQVVLSRKPMVVADTHQEPHWVAATETEWVRSHVSAPICLRDRVLGLLRLDSDAPGQFSAEDAQHLEPLANAAAIAIQNARLYEQVQRHAGDLEQRVAERTRELVEAYERLKELDRLKSKFVTDVSHELRTPVANIKLYLHLLERGKPEKHSQHLTTVNEQIDRLTSLIENILDLSRLDLDGSRVEFVAVDLNAVTEQVVAVYRSRAEAAGLEVIFDPSVALPSVRTDYNQLIQVITNLVDNAFNYTPAGQIRVRTWLDTQRGQVALQVEDTGMGIEAKDLPHIFERFYRGQRVGSSNIPGAGLGLAIVKEIVEQHGGEITVESKVDKGTTFVVWLPQAEGKT